MWLILPHFSHHCIISRSLVASSLHRNYCGGLGTDPVPNTAQHLQRTWQWHVDETRENIKAHIKQLNSFWKMMNYSPLQLDKVFSHGGKDQGTYSHPAYQCDVLLMSMAWLLCCGDYRLSGEPIDRGLEKADFRSRLCRHNCPFAYSASARMDMICSITPRGLSLFYKEWRLQRRIKQEQRDLSCFRPRKFPLTSFPLIYKLLPLWLRSNKHLYVQYSVP